MTSATQTFTVTSLEVEHFYRMSLKETYSTSTHWKRNTTLAFDVRHSQSKADM